MGDHSCFTSFIQILCQQSKYYELSQECSHELFQEMLNVQLLNTGFVPNREKNLPVVAVERTFPGVDVEIDVTKATADITCYVDINYRGLRS